MRTPFSIVCGVLLLLASFQTEAAPAEQAFSADLAMTTAGKNIVGKFYIEGQKMRTEMSAPVPMVTIVRMDKKTMWFLMPAQKMYMEQPIPTDPVAMTPGVLPPDYKQEELGEELIDGRMAKKIKASTVQDGKEFVMYSWVDKDTNLPLKMAAEDRSFSHEYRNLKAGDQDDALFEVPAGYTKMEVPVIPGGAQAGGVPTH